MSNKYTTVRYGNHLVIQRNFEYVCAISYDSSEKKQHEKDAEAIIKGLQFVDNMPLYGQVLKCALDGWEEAQKMTQQALDLKK